MPAAAEVLETTAWPRLSPFSFQTVMPGMLPPSLVLSERPIATRTMDWGGFASGSWRARGTMPSAMPATSAIRPRTARTAWPAMAGL